MAGGHSDHDDSEPTVVEDPDSGQRYLMFRLPIAAWPGSGCFVYECQTCQGRFDPAKWGQACPTCSGEKSSKKKRKRKRKGC